MLSLATGQNVRYLRSCKGTETGGLTTDGKKKRRSKLGFGEKIKKKEKKKMKGEVRDVKTAKVKQEIR